MRAYALIASVFLLILFIPGMPNGLHILLGGLALILVGAVAIYLFKTPAPAAAKAEPKAAVEASKPALTEVSGSAEAEVIAFLGMLQEKGRLIDFLMDDVAQHDDATVGAAARVVHQGCRAVLDEHLKVEPLSAAKEGDKVTVPAGYDAQAFRLSGKVSGEPPFEGTLVHPGWKVTSVKLPKVLPAEEGKLPPLAPAQVDV